MIDKKTESRVLEFITNSREPIHNTEIAAALGINRVTASKYLSVLHSKGLVSFKNVGMAKVWQAVESPILQTFIENNTQDTMIHTLNSLHDGVCVLNKNMQIVWLNKEMEKRHGKLNSLKGRHCFDVFHEEKEICSNCPTKRTFETGKKDRALIRKKEGNIEITTSPLKDNKGKTVAVIEIVRVTKK